ncbi:MAG TPA: sulfotransferase domain-containing protein, partial [Bacteroidales bacterium]|nr:sulfotransferase domain-containing protein [Bacteroidales bacterium]
KSDQPADINELEGGPIASSRQLFDEATGLSSSDLTPEEIENLRPHVYEYIAHNSSEIVFHKIHDALTFTKAGSLLVPSEVTRGALYFVRNPLDVAVSFAHHANMSFDNIVSAMNNNDYAFCSKDSKLHMQLRQKLLTWSNHYVSWTSQGNFPVLVVRYEDMINDCFATFASAVQRHA